MTSQLTVSGDTDGADNVADLQPGDEFRYIVSGTVKSNDGGGVTVDVSGVEECPQDGEEYEEEGEEEGGEMGMGPKSGKTPIAIIAIGGGPKK